MKIFISWSKNKSKLLAEETKELLKSVLGNAVELFFSPEMYKGTRVDHKIHEKLLECDKCLVCITSDNYRNPWMLYEAGVIFGANASKTESGIVIPILFEQIPNWSSWIDKPLNQYYPIQFQTSNKEFDCGKKNFKNFLEEIASENNTKIKSFEKYWDKYQKSIHNILEKEQLIPDDCKFLVDKMLENDNGIFSITSPEITKEKIIFHKGFATTALTKIIIDSVIEYQGKRLWIYGRRNKKILSSENDNFFKFLANEGIDNGVDFRCLLPYPNSSATYKATNKEKERSFCTDLQTSIEKAIRMKNKFNLPVENLFRLYKEHKSESIIVSDNAVLHRKIICDAEGYPVPYTNAEFQISSVSDSNKGFNVCQEFEMIWDDSVPLTEELYKKLYPN